MTIEQVIIDRKELKSGNYKQKIHKFKSSKVTLKGKINKEYIENAVNVIYQMHMNSK